MSTDSSKGIITKGVGGLYTIRLEDGTYVNASARGNLRIKKQKPIIGDIVTVVPSGDPDVECVLDTILPRKNYLIRPPVANVDAMLLSFAVKDPEPDLKLLDKLLVILALIDVKPVVVFTKSDLDPSYSEKLVSVYRNAGYTVFGVSENNSDELKDYILSLPDNFCISFAGPSGVGKSTLCNTILETGAMAVGLISERLKRGKHTTRHVELFEYAHGFVLDTPGFTSLELFELGVDFRNVILGYPEFERLAVDCQYDDCRHKNEKNCAVIKALNCANIDEGRYARYVDLYDDLYNHRNDYSVKRGFYNENK